jgi:hypothetical protein
MALVVADRVQETSITSGTGTLTLAGALAGYQTFSTAIGNGNTTFYTIYDANLYDWEVGIGTVGAGTLARTTVLSNSAGTTSPISFASNSKFVFCTYPAEKSINYDANGVATIGDVLGYSDTGIVGSFASTVAGYNQVIVQNKSTATNASSNLNVSNDAGTAGSNYAELGINSSTFTGSGSFNIAGASYVASASTDLTLGTYGAYNVHFVTNSNTTDAMTIFNDGGISLGGFANPGIANMAASKFVPGYTAVTSAAGTTVLTEDSNFYQNLLGTTTQTFQLPDATTLLVGTTFIFDNDSTGILTITDNASGTIDSIPAGGIDYLYLANNSTVAGTWRKHAFIPAAYDFNNTVASFGNASITNAVWTGTTIATGYGGTGLTTFSAANNALYSTGASTLTAGTLPILAGGTGQTTASTAFNALSPLTTLGDILYGGASGAGTRLGIGSTGQVLTVSGGIPAWSTVASNVSSFQTSLSGLTPSTATTGAVTLAGTLGTTSGGTGLTSYTTGDIIYASATNTLSKLAAGTNGYVLTLASGVPSWAVNNATTSRTTTTFTATAGQTTFTVSYTVGYIDVFRNGVKLAVTDYVATNGTTVDLNTGANVGDTVETVAYASLSVAGGVTSFSAGTTGLTPSTASGGAVTLAGTLAVANGGTGTSTAFTTGSVVFAGASGTYSQDNANLFWDDTNNRLGIGTASPITKLNISGSSLPSGELGTLVVTGNTTAKRLTIGVDSSSTMYSWMQSVESGVGFRDLALQPLGGNVGIGTSSPDALLTVNTIASFGDGAVGTPSIAHKGDLNTGMWFPAADTIAFSEGGTEAMRIDSSGNVGIGTTAPSSGSNPGKFAVQGSQNFLASLYRDSTNPSQLAFLDNNNSCALGTDGNASMVFYNNSRTTERMRIDSSGNVGIGNTPSGTYKLQVTGLISDSKGDVRAAPIQAKTSAYVLVAGDAGQTISITTGGVTVNASIFSAGDMVSIFNNSGSNQTITQGASVTLRLSGTATTGNRTLAQYGIATLLCIVGGATPTFVISGAGLT